MARNSVELGGEAEPGDTVAGSNEENEKLSERGFLSMVLLWPCSDERAPQEDAVQRVASASAVIHRLAFSQDEATRAVLELC